VKKRFVGVVGLGCRLVSVNSPRVEEFCFCESASGGFIFKRSKKADKWIVTAKE
jgi:hypothetical protein